MGFKPLIVSALLISGIFTFCALLAGTEVRLGDESLTVTAGFGVSGANPVKDETIDDLLRKADIALCRAKERVRNRVEVN